MVRHIAAIAVFALLPVHAGAQQCTPNARTVTDEIYRQLLERPGVDSGDYAAKLSNGMTVKEIVRQVAKSPEHLELIGTGPSQIERQRAANDLYEHLLGRRAGTGEIRDRAAWIQQKGAAALVDDFIDSPEYASTFGDWRVPGTNVTYCAGSPGLTARPRGTSGTANTLTAFDRADRNRDGRITVSEWDDTRQAFRNADANRDNVLSRAEYNAATGTSGAVGTSGSRNDQFDQLDSNRNNRLERNEWRDGTESFNWLDRNGDGWLSRGEVVGRRDQ